MPIKKQEEVIKDFIKRHGDQYDYSLVSYVSSITKVNIICKKHGIFQITPNSHRNGAGCYKCGREKVEDSRRLSTNQFVSLAKAKHGENYTYEKVDYKGYKSMVIITCPIHGDFKQQARKHLNGNKCRKCANESYYIDFVSVSKEKFPEYDYSKSIYKGMFTPVIVTCKKHGDFKIKPISLIHKSRGCKMCAERTKSKPEQLWLDSLDIPIESRNKYVMFGSKYFCVDGIDYENRIVYEFYGDFFHGNPSLYKHDDMNPLLKETYGSLYEKTINKEKIITDSGYKLITIWENELKNKK